MARPHGWGAGVRGSRTCLPLPCSDVLHRSALEVVESTKTVHLDSNGQPLLADGMGEEGEVLDGASWGALGTRVEGANPDTPRGC